MILLSRIDDRKAVLGLFNAAYDLMHSGSEASFPRLGQMIVDYENPQRKLSEDLGLSYRVIYRCFSAIYLQISNFCEKIFVWKSAAAGR